MNPEVSVSSRSTTRRRGCRCCSSGCTRRSMPSAAATRWCSSTTAARDRSVARAARAVPEAARRHARGGAGAQCRPAPGDPRRVRADARHLRDHPRCRPAEPAGGDRAPGRGDGCRRGLRRHHPPQPPGRAVAQGRLAPDEPHARGHDLDPHHRPGLHAARLSPQRHRRGQSLHRGEHLRAGARLHLRAPPGGDRGRARGAHGRAVQVLALPADPPELRPDDRLFGGAAAVLLHGRRADRAGLADPGGATCSSAASSSVRKRKACSRCSRSPSS